jgi:hypothetical protein
VGRFSSFLKAIIVDCADLAALAEFWAAALQVQIMFTTEQLSALTDPAGITPEIEFVRVPEAKLGKNRLHFDLRVSNRAAEVERMERLGATVLAAYATWTVMQDPERNEFCVVD